MANGWLWFVAVIFSFQGIRSQGCITIQPEKPSKASNMLSVSFGVKEVKFNILNSCADAFNVSWTDDENGTNSIVNGSISSAISRTSNETKQVILKGKSTTEVTLSSDNMQSSYLTVGDGQIYINMTYCDCAGMCKYNDIRTVDCTLLSNCVSATGFRNLSGNKEVNCGKFAQWETTQKCRRDYSFNFSSKELKVSHEGKTKITCSKANMLLFDKTLTSNKTTIQILRFEDHGQTISCYDNFANDSDALNASVNVLSIPTFKDSTKNSADAVMGEKFSLRILFYANPLVLRSNITVLHSGEPVNDFFFRTVGILHEMLIEFPQVSTTDLGVYNISITGVDEFCNPNTTSTVLHINEVPKPLTLGWIVAISLGGLVFFLLIGITVTTITTCRRKKKDDSDISLVNVTNSKQGNLRHEGYQNSAVVNSHSKHVTNQHTDDDDDEFDTDDYERMDQPNSPTADRPPMPLPPTPRTIERFNPSGPPRQNARPAYDPSPIHSPAAHRGLPPVRSVAPPPVNRNLGPPVRGVAHSLSPGRAEQLPRDYGQEYLNEEDSRPTTSTMKTRMYDQTPPISTNRYR